jgi:hypothetical protein
VNHHLVMVVVNVCWWCLVASSGGLGAATIARVSDPQSVSLCRFGSVLLESVR